MINITHWVWLLYYFHITVCPSDWLLYATRCYKIYGEATPQWSLASSSCASEGASLVSIESEPENDFLQGILNEARQNGVMVSIWVLQVLHEPHEVSVSIFHQIHFETSPVPRRGIDPLNFFHDNIFEYLFTIYFSHLLAISGYLCEEQMWIQHLFGVLVLTLHLKTGIMMSLGTRTGCNNK